MSRYAPLYKFSPQAASVRNEVDLWRSSQRHNIACAEALISNITKGEDADTTISNVVSEYGYDRVRWVLATAIALSPDGISASNTQRARDFLPFFSARVQLDHDLSLPCSTVTVEALSTALYKAYDQKGLLDTSYCISLAEDALLGEKKVLILNPDAIPEDVRTAEKQYFYAYGGNGTMHYFETADICGEFMVDGEKATFRRTDFLGVADEAKLPTWVQQKYLPKKYVEVHIHTPNDNATLFIPMQSLERWIDSACLDSEPLTEANAVASFNRQGSGAYGYSARAYQVVSTLPLAYDSTIASITYAEYVLANAQEPKSVLETISEDIYLKDNDTYGRFLYLTDIDSCEAAKKQKQDYLRKYIPFTMDISDEESEERGRR